MSLSVNIPDTRRTWARHHCRWESSLAAIGQLNEVLLAKAHEEKLVRLDRARADTDPDRGAGRPP